MTEFWRYFRRSVVLGRVAGVPVRADFRWFLVLGLLSALTAASIGARAGSAAMSIALGIGVTLVFFASIFLHEFAHALAARVEKLQVVEIVLHPFGGLTRFRHEPQTPRAEFRIAIAGPAASLLLAVFFAGLTAAANSGGLDILAALLLLLALSNFLLAVFNLLPGYPLDGGRVLRAYLWKNGRDLNEATIQTGRIGQAIAIVLIVLGAFIVVVWLDLFTGIWAALVGVFIFDSARGIIAEANAAEAMLVDDVMQLPVAIEPDANAMHFVDNVLPLHRRSVFPVAKDRHLFGMLMLDDLKNIAREEWRSKSISDVMRPVTPDHFVKTGTHMHDARALIRANGIGAVGVIDRTGKLVGFLQGGKIKGKS
jgi:Zn-dependent protease